MVAWALPPSRLRSSVPLAVAVAALSVSAERSPLLEDTIRAKRNSSSSTSSSAPAFCAAVRSAVFASSSVASTRSRERDQRERTIPDTRSVVSPPT